MEMWLQQQASAVLTALSHAQELYGGPPRQSRPFALRPDLEANLGAGLVSAL
jgi:hypothetical protein